MRVDLLSRALGPTPDALGFRLDRIQIAAHDHDPEQLGRLTPAEKKALAALARGKGNPNPGAMKAGTRLYRSWQGSVANSYSRGDREFE